MLTGPRRLFFGEVEGTADEHFEQPTVASINRHAGRHRIEDTIACFRKWLLAKALPKPLAG